MSDVYVVMMEAVEGGMVVGVYTQRADAEAEVGDLRNNGCYAWLEPHHLWEGEE